MTRVRASVGSGGVPSRACPQPGDATPARPTADRQGAPQPIAGTPPPASSGVPAVPPPGPGGPSWYDAKWLLLDSRGGVGCRVREPGRTGAYLALFSEIGAVLAVTILLFVLAGAWVDKQLHTLPVFLLIGSLLGLATGGLVVLRLITRFLGRYG